MKPHELFEVLASTTWRTIDRATRNRIQYGEDAITSVNLNALASSVCPNIIVEDTRVDEVSKGCDFEFWIGSSSRGWARYAIQAKKINVPTDSYKKLAYKVGGRLQLDVLEQYAKANRAAALYCFYSHSSRPHGWHCSLVVDTMQLGCSVAPSTVVRAAMNRRGGRTFQAIHADPATLPWRCLVRCPRLEHSPALGHPGWPNTNSYVHKNLPSSIQTLLEDRNGLHLIDAPDAFNHELGLRPGWVGVVDVSHINDERG